MGDKFFSEVVNIDYEIEKYGKAICFVCGTGSGKSHWVKNVLTAKGRVLFITSRRAKADEDLVDEFFTDDLVSSAVNDNRRQILVTNRKVLLRLYGVTS